MDKSKQYLLIQEIINKKMFSLKKDRNEIMSEYEIIRISLIAKFLKSVKAIYILDHYGFFEDANILLRTIYEILIILLYCELDTDNYYRYKNYRYVKLKNYWNNLDEEDRKKVLPRAITEIESNYNKFYDKYLKDKPKNEKNFWNGIPFSKTVEVVYQKYKDEKIMELYNTMYKLSCEDVHSDYCSIINNYLKYEENFSGAEINADPEPDENYEKIYQKVLIISRKLQEYL